MFSVMSRRVNLDFGGVVAARPNTKVRERRLGKVVVIWGVVEQS